jgi:hypothetical protein
MTRWTQLVRPERTSATDEVREVDPPATVARRGVHSRPRATVVVALSSLVVAVVAWYSSLSAIHPERSDDLGLVRQLPALWWVSLGFVVIGLLLAIREAERAAADPLERMPKLLLLSGTVLLAVILHGTTSAAESVARFPTAWETAGFTQYIAVTGRTLPGIDARMSWPGFFAGAAFLARAMSVNPVWFLKWTPLVSNLAYLAPLKVIADATLRSTRARWAALWLFIGANWIGQDYFSPQAANFFLYLVVIAVVCRILGSNNDLPARLNRLRHIRVSRMLERIGRRLFGLHQDSTPGEQGQLPMSPRDRVIVCLMIYVIVFASVGSHQLTPVVIGVVAALLALLGRLRTRGLWLVCLVAVVAWTSFAALTFWSGHLSTVVGGAGNVSGNLSQNVASRLHGSTDRLIVLRSRIVLAVLVWTAALVSFVVTLRSGRSHWTMLALLVGPAAVVGGFNYGGEAVLRVYLFSLPAAVVLIALLLDQPRPSVGRRSRLASALPSFRIVCWALTALVVVALFPIARWGNEEFEYVSVGDLNAVEWAYANIPTGATLVSANPFFPWRYDHITDYRYLRIDALQFPLSAADIPYVVARLRAEPAFDKTRSPNGPPTYLILTQDQAGYGTAEFGTRRDWVTHLTGMLERSGSFTVVYRNSDAAVVRLLPR